MHSLYKVALKLFLLLIFSFETSAQSNYNKSFDFYLNPQTIKKNNIKSLIVYVDLSERSLNQRGGYSGKLGEFEFDENGYQNYKLTSNNHGNPPFIEYGRGSNLEITEYNEIGKIVSAYTESYRRSKETINVYNTEGRVTLTSHINEEDTISIAYKWKKDKMMTATITKMNAINKDVTLTFDEHVRLIKSSSSDRKVIYEYTEKNDTLHTKVVTYKSDTIYNTQEYNSLIKFDRIINYIKKDFSNNVIIEMKADLDQHGNATYYYINDLTNKFSHNEPYPPTHYAIQNQYNESNLLIKRSFYFSREDVGKDRLIEIQRFFYDTDKLHFKIAKGSILEKEIMIEESLDE